MLTDEWNIERALAVAERHRKAWPAIPDEKGRTPGVGYYVTVLMADEIDALRAQVAALEEAGDGLADWVDDGQDRPHRPALARWREVTEGK